MGLLCYTAGLVGLIVFLFAVERLLFLFVVIAFGSSSRIVVAGFAYTHHDEAADHVQRKQPDSGSDERKQEKKIRSQCPDSWPNVWLQ